MTLMMMVNWQNVLRLRTGRSEEEKWWIGIGGRKWMAVARPNEVIE
jgi:hypothetical protein